MKKTIRSLAEVVAENLLALKQHAKDKQKRSSDGHSLWTVRGIEDASGVSGSAISRFHRAERVPDIDQLARLAAAYGLQAWELLYPEFQAAAPPAEQMETLFQIVASRMREDELALTRLRGTNERPVSNRREGDGRGDHEIPAGIPLQHPRTKPRHR